MTLAWVVRHPRWGAIGLPLLALLYVRQKQIALLGRLYGVTFRTKLEMAAELVANDLAGWEPHPDRHWVPQLGEGELAPDPLARDAVPTGSRSDRR